MAAATVLSADASGSVIKDIPAVNDSLPPGNLLPPTKRAENLITISPSTPMERGDVFRKYVRPYFGGKVSAFHSPKWQGGALRLAFYNYETAKSFQGKVQKDFPNEVSIKHSPVEVSIRIGGWNPR